MNEINNKKSEIAGPYSKNCLIFAIITMICSGIAGGIFGAWIGFQTSTVFPSLGILLPTISIIIHLIGVMFAVIANVYKSLAKKKESKNTIQTVGGIISLVGLISNIVFVIITVASIAFFS